MRKSSHLVFVLLLACALSACNLPSGITGDTTDEVATSVAQTLAALPAGESTASLENVLPTDTSEPTPTETPQITAAPEPGTISGTISGYPYGTQPRLAIVAIGYNTGNWTYVINVAGDSYFYLASQYLLPGQYYVIAYDSSGNSGGCPGLVTVASNETASCTISDWVSWFPDRPSGVPVP
jgi:predicted small secreted protein